MISFHKTTWKGWFGQKTVIQQKLPGKLNRDCQMNEVKWIHVVVKPNTTKTMYLIFNLAIHFNGTLKFKKNRDLEVAPASLHHQHLPALLAVYRAIKIKKQIKRYVKETKESQCMDSHVQHHNIIMKIRICIFENCDTIMH